MATAPKTEEQVIEIKPERFFKSREEIDAFNAANFPKASEPKAEAPPTPKAMDETAHTRSILEKKLFTLGGKSNQTSSTEKVNQFRSRLTAIKADLSSRPLAEEETDVQTKTTTSFSTVQNLVDDVELLVAKEEGQVDENFLMHRPTGDKLIETMDSIIDKEGKKQSIILEFLPDPSNIKNHLLATLDQLTDSIFKIEHALGKESRLTHCSYEVEGHNMRSALLMMFANFDDKDEKNKGIEKIAAEITERFNYKIKPQAQSKINQEAVKISIEKIKQINELYELYKGLMKYDKVLGRSLLLYRSYEKISAFKKKHPTDVKSFEVGSQSLSDQIGKLKDEITRVSKLLSTELGPVHKELLEIEAQAKRFA